MPPRNGPANDAPKKGKTPPARPLNSFATLPEPSPRRIQAGLARKRHLLVATAIVDRAARSLHQRAQSSKPPDSASSPLQHNSPLLAVPLLHDHNVLRKNLKISRCAGECNSIGRLQNAGTHVVTNQFETELHEGDHKRHRLTDGAPSGVLRSHPGLAKTAGVFLNDLEEPHEEDRFGCVRGVLWSIVFEAALAIAAVIYWKLRLTR